MYRFHNYTIYRFVILYLLVCAISPSQAAENGPHDQVDTAIVLMADISTSVDKDMAERQRLGHARALRSTAFTQALSGGLYGCVAVTYVEWSSADRSRQVLPWRVVCSPEGAAEIATHIEEFGDNGYGRFRGGRTSISSAIDVGMRALEQWKEKAARTVIDISTNGENNDGQPLDLMRERAIEAGHIINAIAFTSDVYDQRALSQYLQEKVIGGMGSFVAMQDGIEDYEEALKRKILVEISALNGNPTGSTRPGLKRSAT